MFGLLVINSHTINTLYILDDTTINVDFFSRYSACLYLVAHCLL